MSKEYGKLAWDELFETAIKLAQDGFVISKGTARMIKSAFNSFPEYAKGFYGQDGNPLKAGSLLKHQVPVRTFADWQDRRPGFMEADLVAHCGTRAEGAFLKAHVAVEE